MHRKEAGKSSDSNSSRTRSPILAGNRILSFMLSVVYIADVYMYVYVFAFYFVSVCRR